MAKMQNYITNQIAQKGESWISLVRPEDIQNSGKRIVKEMIKGVYDYQELSSYFLDRKFLSNLLIHVENELQYNAWLYSAASYFSKVYVDPNAGFYITRISGIYYIYNVISERLKVLEATENIACMLDISSMLYGYRNYLN